MESRFKNANGQLYTKRLFYETAIGVNDKSSILYTLKDNDHTIGEDTFVSLYKRYLSMEDLTEFHFANTYFDSYEHFKLLCACEWFKDHIARWREELRLKLRAKVLERVSEIARDRTSKNSFEANKLLLAELTPKKSNSRGRPSKSEVAQAVKEIAKEDSALSDDHKRIFAD